MRFLGAVFHSITTSFSSIHTNGGRKKNGRRIRTPLSEEEERKPQLLGPENSAGKILFFFNIQLCVCWPSDWAPTGACDDCSGGATMGREQGRSGACPESQSRLSDLWLPAAFLCIAVWFHCSNTHSLRYSACGWNFSISNLIYAEQLTGWCVCVVFFSIVHLMVKKLF